MDGDDYVLEFTEDPAAFLDAAQHHLAADPVLTTVVSSVTHRALAAVRLGVPAPAHPRWWLVVRDPGGAVAGVAMRTAPFAPYPLFVLPMPLAAAHAVARALHRRGEEVGGVNGSLPAAEALAQETARLTGGRAFVHEHTRLFELGELRAPRPAAGRLRAANEDDADLAMSWFAAFHRDADEQAGREPGQVAWEAFDRAEILARIRDGRIWFWVDDAGERVHLTGANAPSFGVARVGPVYTPREHRGRGYASVGRRGGLDAVRDSGCAGLPVHRPGQPDLEQDLRRRSATAGGGHGEPRDHQTRTGLTTLPAATSATARLISSNGYVVIRWSTSKSPAASIAISRGTISSGSESPSTDAVTTLPVWSRSMASIAYSSAPRPSATSVPRIRSDCWRLLDDRRDRGGVDRRTSPRRR